MRNRIKLNSTPVNNPISLKENILVINRIELTENSNLYCKKILADSYLSTVLTPKSVLSYEQKPKKNFFKNQGSCLKLLIYFKCFYITKNLNQKKQKS